MTGPRAARDVAPGQCWAFTDHATLADTYFDERLGHTVLRLPEAARLDISDHVPIRGVSIGGVGECRDGRHVLPARPAE